MRIVGRVCAGYGSASRDVMAGVYRLPYEPYPGTLNLDVDDAVISRLAWPPMVVNSAGIVRRLWPGRIGDLDVHVMHPQGGSSDASKLEVLAAVKLRDALDVEDGDEVVVDLDL